MDAAHRPWWRRRRWIAAAAIWLALPTLYLLATGPVSYAVRRGWLPPSAKAAFPDGRGPIARVPVVGRALHAYQTWWELRGFEDEGHTVTPVAGGYYLVTPPGRRPPNASPPPQDWSKIDRPQEAVRRAGELVRERDDAPPRPEFECVHDFRSPFELAGFAKPGDRVYVVRVGGFERDHGHGTASRFLWVSERGEGVWEP